MSLLEQQYEETLRENSKLERKIAKLTAERDALVKALRKARLEEAKLWNDFHYDGHGGPDCDIYWNQYRIAELERGAKETKE